MVGLANHAFYERVIQANSSGSLKDIIHGVLIAGCVLFEDIRVNETAQVSYLVMPSARSKIQEKPCYCGLMANNFFFFFYNQSININLIWKEI